MDDLLLFANSHFRHYIFLNLGVAAGIAADAMIATLSRFSSFPDGRAALKCGAAIGFTHWLFPLVGFIGGWYAAINTPLSTIVYLVGTIVMTWFISEVVKDTAGFSNYDDHGPKASMWSSRKHFWAAVWAVSLDALITGPGKTSATASWSEVEVWFSFPIVGFVLVMFATYIARKLQNRYAVSSGASGADPRATLDQCIRDRRRLGIFFTVGTWFEMLIFSYFGLLALTQTVRLYGITVDGIVVFIVTGLVGLAIFIPLYKKVRANQVSRAEQAFPVA